MPSSESTTALAEGAPSAADYLADPLVAEMLEHLGDLIGQAIKGERDALLKAEVIWPLVLSELSPEAALHCQAEFVQLVLREWDAAEPTSDTYAQTAAAAVDVLCVLLETDDELV